MPTIPTKATGLGVAALQMDQNTGQGTETSIQTKDRGEGGKKWFLLVLPTFLWFDGYYWKMACEAVGEIRDIPLLQDIVRRVRYPCIAAFVSKH